MLELASVLLLGIGAQWLAWRLRLPSILLLLLFGFAAGPLSGHRWLDPDAFFGDALLPLVSLSVAVILLEGGLSLRLRELTGAGVPATRNLILLGTPITWGLAALGARYLLGFDVALSLLLGAILVVTGPTVIGPLLRHVRPRGVVASVVRWEGIVGDPIGALLAVLVFQGIAAHGRGTFGSLLLALLAGGVAGILGARLLVLALERAWVPDYLHNPVALAIALAAFTLPNQLQHESGLIAVTLMGVLVGNQKRVPIEHIVEFKENLQVLLISSLFILLAARLPVEELSAVDGRTAAFVLFLVLVVRPAQVFVATSRTGLTWREQLFVAWMAPRGIVAAAIASVFALELSSAGHPGADRLVSIVFSVIVATVALYGLTAGWLARRLGLADGERTGVLMVGAHPWARALAKALVAEGLEVRLVDMNWDNVRAARMAGLDARHANVLAESFDEEVPLDGLGVLLCLTSNDQVNSLACLQHASWFGRARTFQIAPEGARSSDPEAISAHLRGRILGSPELGFWDWESRFRQGAVFKRTGLSEEFLLEDYRQRYTVDGVEPAWIGVFRGGALEVFSGEGEPEVQAGDTLLALVEDVEEPVEPRELEEEETAPKA